MALPFIMLAVLFRGIENFKMFDMVNLLTGGGPGSTTEVASITLKREAFENWRTGYSSAFAIILFVTVFGLANIYVKALNRVKQTMSAQPPPRPIPSSRPTLAARSGSPATLVIVYALVTMVPLLWIVADQLQDAAGLDRLSAEGRLPALARGLLQPLHHPHAADAGIHRRAAAGRERVRPGRALAQHGDRRPVQRRRRASSTR